MHTRILALDPSGAFEEGKGTTGWCMLKDDRTFVNIDHISAKDFATDMDYWKAHIDLIRIHHNVYENNMVVVIEDYLLYATEALSQINSRFETVQLIGVIRYFCSQNNITLVIQQASQVKSRWANTILEHKGFIVKKGRSFYIPGTTHIINRHELDAVRHAMHYATFKNKEEQK